MPRPRRPARSPDLPEKWLIYARQSDTDDAGDRSLSLESQEAVLREAAAQRGAIVIGAVRDADLKGYQDETQRPALAEALQRAAANEYDTLAVWELSRLARKLSLQERVLETLERHGVSLYSHREPWASATMVRQILGAVAEEQTRSISAHVRRAVRERQRSGKWHGRVPYGYRLVDERLAPDDELAPWVVAIYERYRDGHQMVEIARWLNAVQAPRWPIPTARWQRVKVGRILANPLYRGIRTTPDGVRAETHPAIVSADLVVAVHARLDRETAPGSRIARRGRETLVETFLRGRLRCGCGQAMVLQRRLSNGRADRLRCRLIPERHGLACWHHPRSIRVSVAERIVRSQIAANLERLRPWRELAPVLRREMATHAPDEANHRRDAERRRTAITNRQDRARELYLSGRIALVDYDALTAPLTDQLAELDAMLAAMPDPDHRLDDLRMARVLAGKLAGMVNRADMATMMAVMEQLGAVAHLDNGVPDGLRVDYGEAITTILAASAPPLSVTGVA